MGDLVDQRVGRTHRHGGGRDRIPPACAALMLPKPHVGNRQSPLRAADQVARFVCGRVDWIFPGCQLPAPRRHHAVGHGDRTNRPAFEPQNGGGKVFIFKPAQGRRHLRLHRDNFAQKVTHQIDVMHEIDRNRPRTRLLAPRCCFKIVIRFVEPACHLSRADLPDGPVLDQLCGLLDDRIVPPVMPHQNLHALAAGNIYQLLRIVCRGRQRLFDEHWNASLDARHRTLDMQQRRR